MSAIVGVCLVAQLILMGVYARYAELQRQDNEKWNNWSFIPFYSNLDDKYEIIQVEIYLDGKRQSCGDILNAFGDVDFVRKWVKYLEGFDNFYFLNFTPFQQEFLQRPFTALILVLTRNQGLSNLKSAADFSRYREYQSQCNSKEKVITFRSKKESQTLLVVPCPLLKDAKDRYRSIQSFSKHAPLSQQQQLYSEIQRQIRLHFEVVASAGTPNVPMFVTTHGLDVPWLHVRLETPLPKHYKELKSYFDLLP
jgi:hypothetical protein